MIANPCPTRDELSDYAMGRLAGASWETVAAHIDGCPECEKALESLSDGGDPLVELLRQPAAKSKYSNEPALQRAIETIGAMQSEVATHQDVLRRIGHYDLLAQIGEGGMGNVYKALHTKLDRIVAFKVLPPDRMEDRDVVARFEREMKAVGKLEHPNIVRAMDAGEAEGTHYLAMEYVDGLTVSALLKRVGPLDVTDACEIIRQAAVGLQHAYEHGLVHRDVKPSNLMLSKSGDVKVLDLGLAKLEEQWSPEGRELTVSGQTMGTLDYMAPEQGADSHDVDVRADIYSLGATLFALLSGEPPFSKKQYDTPIKLMAAIATEEVPSIGTERSDLAEGLVTAVDRMLARRPGDRFSTPGEVAAVLALHAQGADLPSVANRAKKKQAFVEPESSFGETDEYLKSASSDTTREKGGLSMPPVCPAPKRRRLWPSIALATAVGGVLLLSIVLTLTSRYGTLAVETDDPNVQVTVKQGGQTVEIADQQHGWTIRLKEGTYQVELSRGADHFDIDRDSITVRRRDKERVKVTLKRQSVDAPATAQRETIGQGKWVDLLAGVDIQRDQTRGSWRKQGDAVGSHWAGELACLVLPVVLRGSYDLEVEVTRDSGQGEAGVVLPVGESQAQLVLGLHLAEIAGLPPIDGGNGQDNATTKRRGPLTDGNRHKILMEVRPHGDNATVSVYLDDRPYIQWTGPLALLKLTPQVAPHFPAESHLGLTASNAFMTFRQLRLRVVSGRAEWKSRGFLPAEQTLAPKSP